MQCLASNKKISQHAKKQEHINIQRDKSISQYQPKTNTDTRISKKRTLKQLL